MIEKQFHFLAGLPESGNQILLYLLNQNSSIYVTPDSPLLDLLVANEHEWQKTPSVIANKIPEQIYHISEAIINGCWEHVPQTTIIDNCPGWINFLPAIGKMLGKQPKVIMPVRDIPSILASYIKKIHESHNVTQVDQVLTKNGHEVTDEHRVDVIWQAHLKPELEQFYSSYNQHKDCYLLVEFDNLLKNADNEINRIYDFLGLPKFNHNCDLGLPTLNAQEILGDELYNKCAKMNNEFWRPQ